MSKTAATLRDGFTDENKMPMIAEETGVSKVRIVSSLSPFEVCGHSLIDKEIP